MRRGIVVLTVLALAACEGPAGPTGPAGPAGPQGEPGPGNTASHTGVVDSNGYGEWDLPDEAGTLADPPALTCYVAETSSGPYLLISTDTNSQITCALAQQGGELFAVIVGVPAGWSFKFVIVYD